MVQLTSKKLIQVNTMLRYKLNQQIEILSQQSYGLTEKIILMLGQLILTSKMSKIIAKIYFTPKTLIVIIIALTNYVSCLVVCDLYVYMICELICVANREVVHSPSGWTVKPIAVENAAIQLTSMFGICICILNLLLLIAISAFEPESL